MRPMHKWEENIKMGRNETEYY